MNVQELSDKREKLAARIKTMADEFDASNEPWSADKMTEFDRLNEDHKQVAEQLQHARRVSDSRSAVEDFDSQPNNPHGVGYNFGNKPELVHKGERTEGSKPAEFLCAHTGKPVEVLSHGERMQRREDGPLPRIGEVIRAAATGQGIRGEYASQITGDDPLGGFTTESRLSRAITDLARSASIAMKAGASTVPMQSGELVMVRQTSDPEPAWRRETERIPSTGVMFDKIVLRPKTLAAIIPISVELIEDSSNAVGTIERALSAAMGLALDRAILFGEGSEAVPLGITNTEGVQSIALDGVPSSYAQLTRAVEQIKTANYDGEPEGLAWMSHPRDAATYDGLVDGEGQPLMPTPWASKLKKYHTTSFATDQGDGENESTMIVGDMSQVYVGMRTSGVRFQVFDQGVVGDEGGPSISAVRDMMRFIRVYLRADVAIIRPTWLTKITGVRPTA